MKSILKILVVAVGSFFGLNWTADNPMKVKMFRKEVNSTVEQGYEFALFEFRSYQKQSDK